MSGQDYLWLDVIVFMTATAAIFTHLYCLHRCWGESRRMMVSGLLRTSGWLIFSVRFAYVMSTSGDLIIPPPSEIAFIFLAVGDILGVLARRKETTK